MEYSFTVAELAYTAGMMDGDGCVTAYMKPNGSFQLKVTIGNTDRRLLDWIEKRWDGNTYSKKLAKPDVHKPYYHWDLSGGAACELLRQIYPYLVIKQEQADVAIALWENRGSGRGKNNLPQEIRDVREGYISTLNDLNRKGVPA